MKTVGVREFRDHATKYLASGEPLQIERHGKTLGFFIPVQRPDPEERRRTLEALEKTIQRILARTGMTEDELADMFDLSKPL